MAVGNPKDEYLDVSANQRHFMTLRFAQLTVFLALTGFLLNVSLGDGGGMSTGARVLLKIGGLLATLLFYVHQERTMVYWNHFVRRAAEMEEELGFRQYSTRPRAGIVSSFNAMRLFFVVLALFWIAALAWSL